MERVCLLEAPRGEVETGLSQGESLRETESGLSQGKIVPSASTSRERETGLNQGEAPAVVVVPREGEAGLHEKQTVDCRSDRLYSPFINVPESLSPPLIVIFFLIT